MRGYALSAKRWFAQAEKYAKTHGHVQLRSATSVKDGEGEGEGEEGEGDGLGRSKGGSGREGGGVGSGLGKMSGRVVSGWVGW